jgi:signal transduction histidine kinase
MPVKKRRNEDDESRLQDLYHYPLLENPPAKLFSDITRLAAYICGAPVSRISIVDKDHEWNLAQHGDTRFARPRSESFCSRAVQHPDKVFIVPDAPRDERFRDFPQVRSGEVRFYAGAPLVTPGGHAVGMLCVTDETPRELTEEQMDALQALARQVVVLMEFQSTLQEAAKDQGTMQSTIRRLEEAAAGRLRSIGEVFHDMASPLAVMRMQTALLRAKVGGQSQQVDKNLRIIKRSIEQLQNLTQDLNALLIDEKSELRVQIQAADLDDMIEECLRGHEAEARQYNIRMSYEGKPGLMVDADPNRFHQVLSNLLSNAIKFTPDGGQIRVHQAKKGDEVEIRVSDTGRGLEEHEMVHLFEPLVQVHKPQETRSVGTGLGLPIAKRLVEAQGGRIWIESEGHGKGSTFAFTLPLHPPTPRETEAAKADQGEEQKEKTQSGQEQDMRSR